ncbi:MAG: PQQ-binding-like beta-propeller repeat protein [Verrucomicrobiales bacterium]
MTKTTLQFFQVLALASTSLMAADWPQWRGPDRSGHVSSSEGALNSLPSEPKLIWKVQVGDGLSSPVVQGGLVIHFDAVKGKETLHALGKGSGKTVWSAEVDEYFHDSQGPDGPRSTPVINNDKVYAVSCRGKLVCLNLKDGKKIWSVDYAEFGAVFVGEKGNVPGASRHGNNGSPLIIGDRLYACAGGTNGAGAVCLNKNDGSLIWKSQNDQAAYAPPVLLEVAGSKQLVCFTAEGLIGLKPEDGKLLWRVPIKTAFARHVTTPVSYKDVVVVSSHQAGTFGIKVSKKEDGFTAEPEWVKKETAMNFSSPIAVGQYLYGLGPNKNLICVDILTGEEKWSQTGYFQSSADKAHAGMLVIKNNVLTLTDGGMVVLFSAESDGFKELGQAQLAAINWCNPAYSDGIIYLRDGIKAGGGNLYAYQLKP